jgi:hypothetical protein
MSFLFNIIYAAFDPIALVGGLGIGFLFHKQWAQMAWMLLLFVMPGIGSMLPAHEVHGVLYNGITQFVACCLLVAMSYWVLEYMASQRRVAKY